MSSRKPFLVRLKNAIEPVVIHGIGMIVAILFLWAIDCVLQLTMGPNAMFFGTVPASYVIQLGDLLVLGRFIVMAWKDFKDA